MKVDSAFIWLVGFFLSIGCVLVSVVECRSKDSQRIRIEASVGASSSAAPQPSPSATTPTDLYPGLTTSVKMAELEGSWTHPRGPAATISQRKDGEIYPWKLRLATNEVDTPYECGVYPALHGDIDGFGAWRVGYCTGGALMDDSGIRHALRVVLRASKDRSRLVVQLGSIVEQELLREVRDSGSP